MTHREASWASPSQALEAPCYVAPMAEAEHRVARRHTSTLSTDVGREAEELVCTWMRPEWPGASDRSARSASHRIRRVDPAPFVPEMRSCAHRGVRASGL